MQKKLRILLLEDSVADAELVAWQLNHAALRHDIKRVENREDFLQALAKYEPDVILSDHTLPDFDGLSALELARENRPHTPFIFVSGTLGEDRAVDSLKHGASDYVIKKDLRRLPPSILRALEEKRLRHERETALQQLRSSESTFKALAEQAPIGIVLTSSDVKVTFVNEYLCWIVGRTRSEIQEMEDWLQTVHVDDRERIADKMRQLLKDRQPFAIDYRYIRPSGEIRWVNVRVVSQHDALGEITGFLSLVSDITEQRQAAERIARLNRIQEVLSGINSTIVRVSDRDQLCRDACRIAIDKGKFSIAWIVVADAESGKIHAGVWKTTKPELEKSLSATLPKSLKGVSGIGLNVMRSGRPFLIDDLTETSEPINQSEVLKQVGIRSLAYLPLTLANGVFGLLTLGSDAPGFFTADEMKLLDELTEDIAFALDHLAKGEKLNYLAYYDALTGLPNRTLFFDHLRLAMADAKREGLGVAVLVLNIERFRHINESLGESVGDALLRAVAQRLSGWLSDGDSVGRLGGDSFGIFIPQRADLSALPGRLERKIDAWMKQPISIQGHDIIVPLKIGVAFFPGDSDSAEAVFQNANAALKQGKQSGNRVTFYSHAFNERATELLRLETRLRNAVEQEQFVLYYQPKIDLKTGRIGSVEALMRWQDPERGLIPPGEFIPLLEETGLIYDMGMWALQRASDDHARLRKLFSYAPYIAVNVSSLQLQRKTFYDDILRVIARTEDGHHGVDIEITESLIMRDIEDNIRKLREIRDHNVHIAVDDFGTGYSSLAYIAKLPIDILKIDRSFITRMADSDEDRAIVSAIITLAHSLNLKVVAEGVETEVQAAILRMLGCDEAQGYLFCRPIPFDDLVKRLTMSDDVVVLAPG